MIVCYDWTPEEQAIIERCCAWLDDDTIGMCHAVAVEAADQITEPEVAEAILTEILTKIIVRNRRDGRT